MTHRQAHQYQTQQDLKMRKDDEVGEKLENQWFKFIFIF